MRTYKFVILSVVLLSMVSLFAVSRGEAATKVLTLNSGEQCFNIAMPNTSVTYLMRIMFTKLGNGYYSLQGIIPDGATQLILSGGGAVIGNNLIATISASEDHFPAGKTWRDTSHGQITFNLSDLSGSGWSVMTDYDSAGDYIENAYTSDYTVTHTTCPK